MLEGIAAGLPPATGGLRRYKPPPAHRDAGLAGVTGEHYEGGHWLGTFAVYLLTRRGISERDRRCSALRLDRGKVTPFATAEVAPFATAEVTSLDHGAQELEPLSGGSL
jgi:hypothetical protein